MAGGSLRDSMICILLEYTYGADLPGGDVMPYLVPQQPLLPSMLNGTTGKALEKKDPWNRRSLYWDTHAVKVGHLYAQQARYASCVWVPRSNPLRNGRSPGRNHSFPLAESGYYRTTRDFWERACRKSRTCLSKGLSEVVNLLNVPISWAFHYQSRNCTTDTYRIPYSIPIFLTSRYGELRFEHEFLNPGYWYWYDHSALSQNLSELYGSESRRKTTLLRPELFSTTPSYIKYNLYLSSTKIRENPFFLR